MEVLVLRQLSFDFNFPSYTQPISRFLRLLDFDSVDSVRSITHKITMLAMNDSSFLSCRPTILAASSIIISINIYKNDELRKICTRSSTEEIMTESFENTLSDFKNEDKLLRLNTDMWNNLKILSATGLTIETLRTPIYNLANFMCENLNPNKLGEFDLNQILKT